MPTDRKTLSYLRIADEKVREEAFVDALRAVRRAKSSDPENPYVLAYEERILGLLGHEGCDLFFHESDAPADEPGDPALVRTNEILSILNGVTDLIARAEYESALIEIRKARQLDPEDEDVRSLEERIRAAFERQLELEFSRNERVSVRTFISSLVETACASAAQDEFEVAFQQITQGALLDPNDESLKQCASLVTIARNQWTSRRDEREAASHCLAAILDSARKQDVVRHHLYVARTCLLERAYDDALLEIALALTIDPANGDVRQLEQEVWQARTHATAREEASRYCDDTIRLMRLYLLAAEEHVRNGEFEGAIDLIAKMRALDPANPEAKKAEIKIRQLEVRRRHSISNLPRVGEDHQQVPSER
jgi:tetratricopeptide (TPR) repeat protein